MDVYILPKHIWGKMDADARAKYEGTDGVGSGPFVLEEFNKGQFARFKANPNFWGGKPAVDKVVLRKFNNPDAMVAALKTGELDAAEDIPSSGFHGLEEDPNIVTVEGNQGAMGEIAINGGDGLKKPHPALADIEVRKAIGYAIDRDTLVDRVLDGLARPAQTISPSPTRSGSPTIADDGLDFDLDEANGSSTTPATRTRTATASARCRTAASRSTSRYYVRSDGETGPNRRVRSRLAEGDRDRHDAKGRDDSELTEIIGKGDYDMFAWGWTPYVDPDTMLSYMTCDQVAADPDDPTNYYNDANYCDPAYDKLYEAAEGRARHREARRHRPRDARALGELGRLPRPLHEPATQAYRTDRFEGWLKQPADTGPCSTRTRRRRTPA